MISKMPYPPPLFPPPLFTVVFLFLCCERPLYCVFAVVVRVRVCVCVRERRDFASLLLLLIFFFFRQTVCALCKKEHTNNNNKPKTARTARQLKSSADVA